MESEDEKGSTFSIALPQNRGPAPKGSRPDGDPEKRADDGNPWHSRKILIVDDIEMFHDYIKMLVKSASQVFSAYNGLEAIDTARRESPDLILMDLRMPVLDGFEATHRLKSDPATKDIPIIAVTAQAMEEDRERSAQAGVNGYVTKPIDIEVFRNEVARVLGVRV